MGDCIFDILRPDDDLSEWDAFVRESVQGTMFCKAWWLRAAFPFSTNTIRVVTMVDPETQEPFIAGAYHRIGTKKSSPVDNNFLGGLTCRINLESGTLGPGVAPYEHAPDFKDLVFHSRHPDTDSPIEGEAISRWNEVVQTALIAAYKTSFLLYVGWDMVVTDKGVVIIEGNSHTDIMNFQVHEPLLKQERIRRFFEHYGIL